MTFRSPSISVALVALLALLTGALGWTSYRLYARDLADTVQREERARAQSLSNVVQAFVQHHIDQIEPVAKLIATQPQVATALAAAAAAAPGRSAALQAVLDTSARDARLPVLEAINLAGQRIYPPAPAGNNSAPAAYWGVDEALGGSSARASRATSDGVQVLAIEPVRQGAVVVGAISAGILLGKPFLDELSRSVGASLALVSRKGNITLSGSDVGDVGGARDQSAITEAFSQKTPIHRHDANTRATLVYLPLLIVDDGYVMVVRLDSSAAYRRLDQSRAEALTESAVIFAVVVALALLLQYLALRPLILLQRRAQAVACEFNIVPTSAGGGNTIASVVATLDQLTTQLVLRNAQLARATRDAESASLAKSQFLANMSHEIRTPMNAVLGLSEMLAASGQSGARLGPPLTGTQLHYARTIHNSAGTLLALINDVLDVSRIEEGHFALDLQPFALAALLEGVRSTLEPLAGAKRLRLDIDVDASLPRVLTGDAARLRQIVLNLAGNAIKFTAQGRVGIEVRAAAAASDRRDGVRLAIRVTDTGSGITPDQLERLFERFVQVDGSDTRRHGGSGLGLYIVRELAQRMGGGVSARSVPGLGSVFEVTVELAQPSGAALAGWNAKQAESELAQAAADRQHQQLVFGVRKGTSINAGDIAVAGGVPLADVASAGVASAGVPAAGLAAVRARAEAAHDAAAPRKVLLAEDNEINRMVARGMLATAGHTVIEAVDGVQALACHAAQTFDCILMDIQMPVMGGIEATREIRAREAEFGKSPIPIIALTANAMQGDRERYLAAGMNDFLAKPYERADLLAVLARMTPAKHDRGGAHGTHGASTPASAASVLNARGETANGAQWPAGEEPLFDATALDGLINLDKSSPGLLVELVTRFIPDTHGLITQLTAQRTAQRTAQQTERQTQQPDAQSAAASTSSQHGERAEERESIALAAHTLKSTCERFGALRAAALARSAEQAIAAGDLDEAQRLGAGVRTAFTQFEALFRQHPAIASLGI